VQVPAWAAVVAEHRPHVETLVTENDAPINNLDSAKPQQEWLLYARTRLRRDSEEFPHATTRLLLLQAAQSIQPYLGRFVCDGACVATQVRGRSCVTLPLCMYVSMGPRDTSAGTCPGGGVKQHGPASTGAFFGGAFG